MMKVKDLLAQYSDKLVHDTSQKEERGSLDGEAWDYFKAISQSSLGEIKITGLSSDSRYAKKGDLFFALKGQHSHGLTYLKALEEKEVALILYEEGEAYISGVAIEGSQQGFEQGYTPLTHPPLREVPHLKEHIAPLAYCFYYHRIKDLNIIGVTGTEGKTSVTQFVAQAFDLYGKPCALIGTNGIGFLNSLQENTHTTPDLLALYRSLEEINQQFSLKIKESFTKSLDCKDGKDGKEGMRSKPATQKRRLDNTTTSNSVVERPTLLEVTSHALSLKRIEALSFLTTVFTNLNRDHLDFHGTLKAYGEAKTKLFTEYSSQASVLNTDDALGRILYQKQKEHNPERTLYPYGQERGEIFAGEKNFLQIKNLTLLATGLEFSLCYKDKELLLKSPLYGGFNAYNLTACFGVLLSSGLTLAESIPLLEKITPVRGRMEPIILKNGVVALVDYAHKPNALKEALVSLHAHRQEGRIMVVFGCGGDRDKGKRPLMAAIAEANADNVFITSDNPRSEDPEAIMAEICQGLKAPKASTLVCEVDRKKAIERALLEGKKGDIILVAGKGHEDYQIIGGKTLHFSDREVIEAFNCTL